MDLCVISVVSARAWCMHYIVWYNDAFTFDELLFTLTQMDLSWWSKKADLNMLCELLECDKPQPRRHSLTSLFFILNWIIYDLKINKLLENITIHSQYLNSIRRENDFYGICFYICNWCSSSFWVIDCSTTCIVNVSMISLRFF